MECLNNNTNSAEKASEPQGLYLLRTNHLTEDQAVSELMSCCENHPHGCGRERECLGRFDIRTETWPLRPYKEYKPKPVYEAKRYSGWMPYLKRNTLINIVRERPIY
jgi:hypothetical protein